MFGIAEEIRSHCMPPFHDAVGFDVGSRINPRYHPSRTPPGPVVPPSCLTVLAPIRPGEEDALRAVLRPIGDDIKGTHMSPGGRPHISFTSSASVHFARLAILSDPDRGPRRTRLFVCRRLRRHVRRPRERTGRIHLRPRRDLGTMRTVFLAGRDSPIFSGRTPANRRPTTSRFVARPSPPFGRRSPPARRGTVPATPECPTHGYPLPVRCRRLWYVLRRVLHAAPIVVDLVVTIARTDFANVYHGTLRILASLNRYPVFQFVNR
jgi:hypothetical protein